MKRIIAAVLRRVKWKFLTCLFYLFRVFPIKNNKIVISSYFGRGYGDNAKYIIDELLKASEVYDIVWLLKDVSNSLPCSVRAVKYGSFSAIFEITTAKAWIDNCRKPIYVRKRRKQFYIQTWHGGGAQKKCENDSVEVLNSKYVESAINDSAMADLMISDSRFMTELYHRSFWYDGPVFECGYPRYDILLKYDEALASKVYAYYGIDRDKELVLYAPTFRADYSFDAYNIDFERLKTNLNKRFRKDFVILVHLHPNVANVEGGINYDGRTVINSTFYPDTQELIAVSSILIGDYSSINYDFSLKRLPVFRYTSDLEAYRNDRDLYFAFDEYPYPYARDNDELENLILNFDQERYLSNLNAFFDKLGAVVTDDASENVAGVIVDYLNCNEKNVFFKKNKNRFVYKQ